MEKLPRQKNTEEFRELTVRFVIEKALTNSDAARCLAISDMTPREQGVSCTAWAAGGAGETCRTVPVTDLEAEVSGHKHDLAELAWSATFKIAAISIAKPQQLPARHS